MNLPRNQYQRNTSWNAPYTFSGKEKDAETGYGYFGARYYDSGLSIWLSVDPMSDKYPSMSPYNYCANNPVILVDPDGREVTGGPDDPFGTSYGSSSNASKTPVPFKELFPGLAQKENKFPYKQDQSTSQSGSTATKASTTNNANNNNSTTNQNQSSKSDTYILPKVEIPKLESAIGQGIMEILKSSTLKPVKSIGKRYLFAFTTIDIYNNTADIYNNNSTVENSSANVENVYNLCLVGISFVPMGYMFSTSIETYRSGAIWLKNYIISLENDMQQKFSTPFYYY